MKLTKYALALVGLVAVTAYAAPRLDDSIADLNAAVADLLKPYQTDASKATIAFQTLTTDDSNVLTTRVTGAYQRVGKVQTLDVRLAGLTFDFASGNPIVNIGGSAAFDLTQVFQQEQINNLVDAAEGMVEDIASNYTKAYGAAAQVKGTMIEKIKDANGNYTAFNASVAFKIDMSKLPANKKTEDVALLNGVVFFNVVLNKSITLDGTVMLNPAFKGFHGEGTSLKMAIEKLLNRDGDTGKKITAIVDKMDKMASGLVDAKIKD